MHLKLSIHALGLIKLKNNKNKSLTKQNAFETAVKCALFAISYCFIYWTLNTRHFLNQIYLFYCFYKGGMIPINSIIKMAVDVNFYDKRK